MLTLVELRRQVRALLDAASTWPDATLDRYIADAIRFYSLEFPRRLRATLTLTTGHQVYDLPGGMDLQTVLSVEYPAGSNPPEFVAWAEEWSRAFRAGAAVYALRGVADAHSVDDEDETATGQIVFAETVTTGQTAVIEYLGLHPAPAVGDRDAVITVPEAHIEALIAFVDFRAHWSLEIAEAVSISNVSIILSQLGTEGRMAWRRYKEVVERLQALTPRAGARVVWAGIGL